MRGGNEEEVSTEAVENNSWGGGGGEKWTDEGVVGGEGEMKFRRGLWTYDQTRNLRNKSVFWEART